MGISSSCESTSVETSKLVLYDGTLQEFTYPVKVQYLMHEYPSCFICYSDDMVLNDAVLSMNGDETLQVGQLYFALPLGWLKRRIQGEEMAALAVKASSALSKCGYRKKSLFVLTEKLTGKVGDCNVGSGDVGKVGDCNVGSGDVVKRGRDGGGKRGGKFNVKLNSISE